GRLAEVARVRERAAPGAGAVRFAAGQEALLRGDDCRLLRLRLRCRRRRGGRGGGLRRGRGGGGGGGGGRWGGGGAGGGGWAGGTSEAWAGLWPPGPVRPFRSRSSSRRRALAPAPQGSR